jgi:hypothetical protein
MAGVVGDGGRRLRAAEADARAVPAFARTARRLRGRTSPAEGWRARDAHSASSRSGNCGAPSCAFFVPMPRTGLAEERLTASGSVPRPNSHASRHLHLKASLRLPLALPTASGKAGWSIAALTPLPLIWPFRSGDCDTLSPERGAAPGAHDGLRNATRGRGEPLPQHVPLLIQRLLQRRWAGCPVR